MKKKPGMQRAYRRVAVIVTESANVDQSSREWDEERVKGEKRKSTRQTMLGCR